MSKNNDKLTEFKIPTSDILNIFQISNPEIFNESKSDEEAESIYVSVIDMLNFFGAPTSNILEDMEAIRNYATTFACSNSGGFIMSVGLNRIGENGEIEN